MSNSAGNQGASARAMPASKDESTRQAAEETKMPLLEDIMQLARLGEIEPVRQLLKQGKYTASHKDEDGITPLHWAAINNHYAMCKFLLENGAEVNAKGGDAVATAAMWAAQRCNYYVVHLLLQHGADPLLTDVQGYNILHLATFDGNVFLLILLLHQNIPVDTPDLQGHTSLMWAAYKGYPACVDLFLRWGANVEAKDDNGFTALHWSLVTRSQPCIQKLIEYGSDRFAETNDGKTPIKVATEMNSLQMWYRALAACGYQSNGQPKEHMIKALMEPNILTKFYFFFPFLTVFVSIYLLSGLPIFVSLPLTAIFVYTTQWIATTLLKSMPPDSNHIHKTPFLAGVFAATAFWLGFRWLTKILPNTYQSNLILNLLFATLYGSCTYFYFLCMTEDPGFVPKGLSRMQQKAVVDELFGLWKFDEQNFCVQCMIRTPLRSKHCKRCKRCVSKHDHHCPWVHNCVGANNLRHFFLYILTMEFGIVVFIALVITSLENLPAPTDATCNILSEDICKYILRDPFTVVLTIWASLQLTWVTMLVFVQCVQIARATTTYEAMKGHNHGASKLADSVTAALTAGASSTEGAQLPTMHQPSSGPGAPTQTPAHGHSHVHRDGFFAQWKKLLGLDTFVATAQSGLDQKASGPRNPYSRGVLTNCRDFWCDPAPIFGHRSVGDAMLDGEVVNYTKMYEIPPRMRLRRGDNAYESLATEEV